MVDPTAQTMILRDGRTIGFAEFGPPDGYPIFFLHGGGDSRMQRGDDAETAAAGVWLISPDRPGVGLSTFQRGRRLGDWAGDIAQLADHLGLDRFAVLGYSMGGPHALACAVRLTGRLDRAGVVSGIAPFHRPGGFADTSPFVRRMFRAARVSHRIPMVPLYRMVRQARRDPGALLDSLFAGAAPEDRLIYERYGRRDNQIEAYIESSRQGPRALAWELSLVARPWGLPLGRIQVPVHLWYGGSDTVTPLQMAHFLAGAIPTAELTVWPGEGHQAIFGHWREVLAALRS